MSDDRPTTKIDLPGDLGKMGYGGQKLPLPPPPPSPDSRDQSSPPSPPTPSPKESK